MALLRLLCFPSTSHCPRHQFFCGTTTTLPHPNSSSLSLPPSLSLSTPFLTIPHKPTLFPSHVLSSTIDTPQIEQPLASEEVQDEAPKTRLLAQNVPWTCTPDDIRSLFAKYGSVLDVEVSGSLVLVAISISGFLSVDNLLKWVCSFFVAFLKLSMFNKTRNRGLAFVTMGSHEEALAAFTNLESYEFEGRILKLAWAEPKKKRPSTPMQPKPVPIHNLFVANLPFQARAKDLKEFFNAENANVVSAEIIFNENPRGSAGYGFVSFNTKQEAEAALTAFQGKVSASSK
ncbi:hypothetical protein RJ639_040872 [Escallonia herrerae]|uniref:RRM domain-containing protein n=1 Tax=Escallonia herrerae TaxID=1293975 RepID=A0AA88WDY0_9ASTE|nr:hypothetical protein RJ639_040872 [Escallonia herrerae]